MDMFGDSRSRRTWRASARSPGVAQSVTARTMPWLADAALDSRSAPALCQVEALRRGLASVIPCQLLRLFSWEEVEGLVCGKKEVDLDLLEACTEYSLCDRSDPHVSAFWDVLRAFSPKEKSLFLRYEVRTLGSRPTPKVRPGLTW